MSLIILEASNPFAVAKVIEAVLDFAGEPYDLKHTNKADLAEQNAALRKMLECVQNNLAYGSMGKLMQKLQAKAISEFLEEL